MRQESYYSTLDVRQLQLLPKFAIEVVHWSYQVLQIIKIKVAYHTRGHQQTRMKHRISTLCLVALAVVNSSAFVPAFRRTFWSLYVPSCRPPKTVTTCLYDSTEEEIEKMSGGTASQLQMAVEEAYPNAEILTIQLQEHRPLGCTVEESVDIQSDPSITFVSKVVEGGNADKAGIKVGDVLIGVTGLFDMMPVFQSGVDKM